ncbi:hypothetical protein [Lentzea aerocolonigenes]|uniref:hypothetical protein n=1 Tax=Lentzea aerocolonigenes TaxID=68170 RepID=UPI000689A430|nr:hypothetical protein [Lentzea aerocolonigenes]MCP2250309.1 hypothetical protein [Lentzea aerocolonigenes]
MAARGETQANVEVSTLVVPAWRLRWRAPELALVLGERALALASARHDEADRLRAESLVVFAGNRVGRGVRVADRAIDALKAAEAAGEYETAWLLRVELAACARSVGAPLTGFAAVTPVLEAPDVPAELRASALVQASECLVTVGRGDEPTLALAEADQLYVADTTLDDDTRLLLRGLIRAVQAARHRRWGDIAAAIGAAREGLDLLSRFADPSADSGQGLGRLTLELVLALMDANRLLDASAAGTPLLDRPVRAPSASTTGWLRLALATRVHLPAGRVALAREMLHEAAVSAERHQLDTLMAESLLALAHVHEVSGELAEALTNLRSAHAAERRRARAVYAVRARLAAEFSGVHRQPADLHQQLASLLRPVEGMPAVTDGVLSAALKQQLRQWRPVQVRKGEGLKDRRVRRAAEDMTVEGLSAARQHAADRWRMVQPFGEPDDKTPEPVELPPASPSSSSDRTVPASGLIASAGAMVSGRRRAARVAAGEIEDDQPTTVAETPPAPEPSAPQLSVEQERKRKVEQQLMELQREARRQIEAERQARAEQRAQAEREAQAAEEAARQEAARQEAARQEAAREEAARQEAARQEAARLEAAAREEAARQEAARLEAARQEAARLEAAREEAARKEEARREAARQEAVRRDVARQEAAHQEVARQAAEREAAAREEAARAQAVREETGASQPESVLDMLKAQGLRAGGRRRAKDTESPSGTPSWRVEPPSRLRQEDSAAEPQKPFAASAGAHTSAEDQPNHLGDQSTPDRPSRSGLSAAFARPPAAPDFGPHLDEPAYPPHTPASGFPSAPQDPDERKLPDLDFSSLDFSTPKPAASPEPEPDREPLPPVPDPIPSVPTPDEIPQPSEPDLMSSTFLSSADVEDDVPTVPVPRPDPAEKPTFGTQPGFGTQPTFGTQTFGTQPTFGTQTGFGTQPAFGSDPAPGTQPDPAGQSGFGSGAGFGGQSDSATQPGFGSGFGAQPDSAIQSGFGSGAGFGGQSDSATQPGFGSEAGFGAQPDSTGQSGIGSETGFGAQPDSATKPGVTVPEGSAQPDFAGGSDSTPQYDFFATGSESPDASAQASSESADATPTTPISTPSGEQAGEQAGESGGRAGRPSSRRRPSDLSLADLLAEALVAYETGRRSDEEQLEAADLSPADWSAGESGSSAETASEPAGADSAAGPGESFGSSQASAVSETSFGSQESAESGSDAESNSDSIFRFGLPPFSTESTADARPAADSGFGSTYSLQPDDSSAEARPSSDSYFGTGQSFGTRQDTAAEALPSSDAFGTSPSFGSPQVPRETGDSRLSSESYFLPEQPSAEPQPFTPQPTAEPFLTQPAAEPFVPQPASEPFLTQPAAEPFVPQPAAEPYVPQPAAEPFAQPFAEQQPYTQQPFSQQTFGSQPLASQPFTPQPEANATTAPPAESEQEKTGPIVPVGAAPDSETTGPIRPVRPDGPAGWTLPGA